MRSLNFLILLLAVFLQAGEQDLVVNGTFAPGQTVYPSGWKFYNIATTAYAESFEHGGPRNGRFLRIHGNLHLNQKPLALKNGEKYKLSCYARTKKQTPGKSGIRFDGFGRAISFDGNQPEWTFYEKEFIYQWGKRTGLEMINIGVDSVGDQLDITDLKLIPVSDGAKAVSASIENSMRPILLPVFLTNYIPLENPELIFHWEGKCPGDLQKLICTAATEKPAKEYRGSFQGRELRLSLKDCPAGENKVTVRLSSPDGKLLYEKGYDIRLLSMPPFPAGTKKLNNLVSELPKINLDTSNPKASFPNPRQGWVYFLFRPNQTTDFELVLNGKKLLDQTSVRHEAFRCLEPGIHSIEIRKGSGTLTIRAIPETTLFPIQTCLVSGEIIDWNFTRKHILGAITTTNRGGDSKRIRAEGHHYLENFGMPELRKWYVPASSLLESMNKSSAMQSDRFDGCTLDELDYGFSASTFNRFTDAYGRYHNPKGKTYLTYVTGPVCVAYQEFFSTAINAAGGKGKLLHECYERTKPTETDIVHHLDQMTANMSNYWDKTPLFKQRTGTVLELSSEAPLRTVFHYPEQDPKYYLDMVMHRIATDPVFDGLGAVGYWGGHNASGEMMRWAMKLLRHYAIEGNTEMLSAKYGYRLFPGHLQNADFAEQLAHWNTNGLVSWQIFPQYGEKMQNRTQAFPGVGDNAAVLSRGDGNRYAELSQTLTNLIPGQRYSLSYLTCDADDIKSNEYHPKEIKVDFSLTDVTLRSEKKFTDVRFIKGKRITSGKKPCINQRFITFIPQKTTSILTLHNKNMLPGSRTALNFIAVRPFFFEKRPE